MHAATQSFQTRKLNTCIIALSFVLTVALIAPRTAKAANLVQNPGFETGNLTDWYLTGDKASMLVDSDDPHSGTYAFDAGPAGGEGYINQDFSTLGKNTFNLSFWIDQRNVRGNFFEALWDGKQIFQLNNSPQTGYQEIQINGLQGSGGTDTLSFGFIGVGPKTWALDDVDLEQTPEPGSLILLGTGVVGLAGVMRRRFS
jgi:hypothetical protein